MKKRASYKWCIFHFDNKLYKNIANELLRKGYNDIKVYIPTLSLLKRRSKGKDIYEAVPMLFSYGFIRMPQEKAYSRYFLRKLKKDIPGIHSWVNSLEGMHPKKKRRRIDSEEFDDFSKVATVEKSEIKRFRLIEKKNKVFSNDDIANTRIGSYITLRGYPFEGVEAIVDDISISSGQVSLTLYPEGGKMKVKLPMANVIYSVYSRYDPDDMNPMDNQDVTEESLSSFFEKNTY